LNVDHEKAIAWFIECVAADPILLGVRYTRQFVHNAAYRDLNSIWPVIESMLNSQDANVVWAGALEVCLLGLDLVVSARSTERVERGTTRMREAAATVYAANVSHQIVGAVCRNKLKPFFSDPEVAVRTGAAKAFEHIGSLDTPAQSDLLAAFLDSKPGPPALELVVRALDNSQVQLPYLVCQLTELCIDAYRNDASDIRKSASATSMNLSKIVVRLYAHTEDPAIQARCLSIIDEMERHHFLGLSEELQRLDR